MKKILSAKYRCFVVTTEILLLLVLLPVFYHFIPINKEAKNLFYLPSSNIEEIVNTLEQYGYSLTFIDKIMLQLIKPPQKGWYKVDKNAYGRFIFFVNLHNETAETMQLIVYSGETADELTSRLAKDTHLDKNTLLKAYVKQSRFKEGDIFARRYTIAKKANENVTIDYMFNKSTHMLNQFVSQNFRNKPDTYALKILLTIASIIQRESNDKKEMPLISSVIYNRLEKGMKLQMDGTLNYGKYSRKIITPERIKTDTSYYNTYKYKGLPTLPLGTVNMTALHAAMFPANTDYLFFMLNPDGHHTFSENYKKHLENIRIFRKYQKNKKIVKNIC